MTLHANARTRQSSSLIIWLVIEMSVKYKNPMGHSGLSYFHSVEIPISQILREINFRKFGVQISHFDTSRRSEY